MCNIEWFVFGGGDPLLRQDLADLIVHAKEMGMKTDLQSNAILFDDAFLSKVSSYLDKVGFSLDGHDKNTHDIIRNYQGNFDIVMDAIQLCYLYNVPVTIRSTVMKGNIGRLCNIGDIVSDFENIRKWSIREYVPLGRGFTNRHLFSITRECFNIEIQNIIRRNTIAYGTLPIVSVSAEEMKNCYCLVSPSGMFYNHPSSGLYKTVGKFPDSSVKELIPYLEYDAFQRRTRELRELAII